MISFGPLGGRSSGRPSASRRARHTPRRFHPSPPFKKKRKQRDFFFLRRAGKLGKLGNNIVVSFFLACYLVFLSLTGFCLVFLGFSGFYLVLLGFTGFYWFLPSFTGFYLVLLGFT